MAVLGNPKNTIEILQKYQFNFQKKFGQNFLIDNHVLNKIMKASDMTKEDVVLEIGPGIGTLTQYLAEAAKKVIAVEIDGSLLPVLEETLQNYDNVKVIHGDILQMNLNKLIEEENAGRPVKVVANLPYYITTPIIMSLLEGHIPVKSATVMVQKEVAERMRAKPGTKDYGALSLAIQYYTEPYIAANVPPNCFLPRPRVGSAVICLRLHENPPVSVENEDLLFKIIRASFNQRRKTLINGLCNAANLTFTREQIREALRELSLPEEVRGERLSLEQFSQFSNILSNKLL